MRHSRWSVRLSVFTVLLLAVSACAPAAQPAPTAAPAQPAATTAPAKPAATTAPAKPAATQAAAKPAASPAAKAAFDEKAIADFYQGKTIKLIVATSAGGGYDAYSRLIARHLGKHIPGNPNVIVENMPGAGHLIGANHVYNAAPKDGTVIGNFSIGAMAQQIFGNPAVEFDAAKFHYLSVPTTDTDLCVATKASGITSLADTIGPNGKELIIGGDQPSNSTGAEPRVLKEALGANLRIVSGYDGTSKIRLAMDQGEVDGLCGWSWESAQATAPEQFQSGEYVVVSQNSVDKPHRDLPDVPVPYQLATTDEARQLIRYGIVLMYNVQREYAMAPEVPADRVQAMRQAFDKTFADKEFQADAAKAKLTLDPVSGEQAEQLVKELVSMPTAVKDKLTNILK